MMKVFLKNTTALMAVLGLLQPSWIAIAAAAETSPAAPAANVSVKAEAGFVQGQNGDERVAALLRDKIKYVFVIFNENHSFDNEYGTLPGVNGLYSDGTKPRSAADTPGFKQSYTNLHGNTITVQPFRLGPQQNATFRDSVDHSHTGLARKLDVVDGVPHMDHFAADEYAKYAKVGNGASQRQGAQFAQLVMSHIDCDTIPFFWQYANRFTIFDNIFATEDTPSTPNAVAMLAGQSGETQWVKHPSTSSDPTATGTTGPISGTINGTTYSGTATTQGPPLVNDPQPWYGSEFDKTKKDRQPTSPKEFYGATNIASNLTFASVPLTLMGGLVSWYTNQDRDPAFDLPDIKRDIRHIDKLNQKAYTWHWYQNGYDLEPTDTGGVASHTNYVTHHNGAQYFGYLANNPALRDNYRGENDFFVDAANKKLPKDGGVFYIRGGYYNLQSQTPPIQNAHYPNPAGLSSAELATINATKSGDDDHPGYSDSQLSEALAARVVNAIAADPEVWAHSAIIITYDESDGFYDHVPPRILSYGPDGLPLSRGVRVPLILISPYAKDHAVSHAEGDHNAVIETINAVFGRPALSRLPDEADALLAGNAPAFNKFGPAGFKQKYLGPRDTNSPITDSLLSGFDLARLRGDKALLAASYATIPSKVVETLPHYGGNGCKAIGITPEDQKQGITSKIPSNFNALPSTFPAYN